MLEETEGRLRGRSSQYLHLLEAALYISVGILLSATAIAVLVDAGGILFRGILNRTIAGYGLQVLDQLLFVLVLVEILHTVRISIRAQEILIEPFLIVGLIASVRRVLVITMQAAKMTEEGHSTADTSGAFHNSMIELGLLGVMVLVFVLSIYLLRRAATREKLIEE
ncbi:MAG: phosphate-starvation-inducible PsiE family protein [Acidobacteriota bacterium]|nr:phosphate-starvation-inducible PsiE family protein [Acidobacteriota bacterium]